MKLSEHQWEFLKDVTLLIQYADRLGWKLTAGEVWRPNEMQELYMERGLTKAEESYHQKRLAIDLNLFIDDKWQRTTEAYKPLGHLWESLNEHNCWGGNFSTIQDGNHFERAI